MQIPNRSRASPCICAGGVCTRLGPLRWLDYCGEKAITGYVDDKGNEKSQFDRCNFGRKIMFDDRTYLTCRGYSYHYAYRPDAILLVRNNSWLMIVDDEEFEVSN